jgi:hypothetical protein
MQRKPLATLLEEKRERLPSVIRELFDAEDTVLIVSDVSKKFELTDEEETILFNEIAYTLLGENTLEEFRTNVIENLELKESKGSSIAAEISSLIFTPVKKFLRSKREVYLSVGKKEEVTTTDKTAAPQSEDLNHHDILSEIETPTPSLKSTGATPEIVQNTSGEGIKVMSKDAQDLIKAQGSDEVNTTTTKAPTLQEAVGSMPDIGGFIPVNNVLAPSQKVADGLDSKLTTPSATPMKEVFVPKKLDPYREPAE